jgi:hypothetical protein
MTPDEIRKIVMFGADDFAELTVRQTVTVRVSRQEAERLARLGVAGEVLHECQRVNCDRTFTRHEGRSVTGRRRARGVLYCSAACAQAQGQHEYRKRLRSVSA